MNENYIHIPPKKKQKSIHIPYTALENIIDTHVKQKIMPHKILGFPYK
jgi:hypothetical protein